MSALFGGGSKSSGPGPEYYESLKRQEANLKKQEDKLAQQEADALKKLQATKKARGYAGFQLLLSPERENAELGLSTTLSGAPSSSPTSPT